MLENLLAPHIPTRFLEDERYRNGHIRIINPLPGVRILGLHIPDIRKTAATLVKEGKASTVIRQFEQKQSENPRSGLVYEEKMLWGFLISRLPSTLRKRLDSIRQFIPAIDNWAVCDSVCSDAKWCKKNRAETWDFLLPYFRSKKEFEVRFALIMALAHFLTDDYIDLIFEEISRLKYDDIVSDYEFSKVPTAGHGQVLGPVPYYVNMAVAWLMATALCKFPEKTRTFANSGSLPDTVTKLYIRKARESFRTRNTVPL